MDRILKFFTFAHVGLLQSEDNTDVSSINMSILQPMIERIRLLVCFLLIAVAATTLRANEQEVRAAIVAYVEAFNKRDIESLGNMWAENSVHIDLTLNQTTQGRESIQSDLKNAFESNPNIQLSGTVEDIRIIREEIASVSGEVMLSNGMDAPSRSHFNAVLVKSNGRWMIDKMEETSVATPLNAAAALRQLEWLVGQWQDNSQAPAITSNIAWAEGNGFLIRTFQVASEEGSPHHSTQIIGWDPSIQQIRSWTFNADGSFGQGFWTKEAAGWAIAATQTLSDGRHSTGTYLMDVQDPDHFTMQLIGHEIDGEPQSTLEPIQVVRIRSAADASEASADASKPKN